MAADTALRPRVQRAETLIRQLQSAAGGGGGAPSGPAGGVLSGTYPNPGFAVDMATQAELDTHKSSADHDGRYYTEAEIDTALALKAPLASPVFTGDPTAPTAAPGDNDTSLATTAFVTAAAAASLAGAVILAPGSSVRNTVQPSGDFVPLVLKNNAAQTVAVFEHRDSAGALLASLTAGGKFKAAAGSISAPAYGFSPSSNSGMFSDGSGVNVSFAVSGVEVLRLESAGGRRALFNTAADVLNPDITFVGDPNTGVYRVAADQLGLVVGGAKEFDVAVGKVTVVSALKITNASTSGHVWTASDAIGNGSWQAPAVSSLAAAVILAPAASTRNVIQPTGDFIPLVSKGNAAQTVSLQEWQDSAAAVKASISSAGKGYFASEVEIDGALNHDGTTVGFYGVAPVARSSAYTPTNRTTDRAYDCNATTLDEVADVLATVILDLQSVGLLG